ncbi:MAG: rhodanese-like domain-containing protein [Pseudopelagicola sp.]|nr:rhodanese-like domain-containing protein [Pseudopelagicola sp.]
MFFLRQKPQAEMSVKDAVDGAKTGDIIVIDVRDQMELKHTGIAEGALHVPLMRLRDIADPRHPDFNPKLKNDGKIAIYCASGARSHSAVTMLRRLGYEDVYNIGGLSHWVRAGGGVTAV